MKKFFLLFPILLFGDIDPFNVQISQQNYNALTPQEKQILKNKIDIQRLSKDIKNLKLSLNEFRLKIVKYDETLDNLSQKISAFNTIISEIDSLKSSLIKLKKDNNLTLQKVLALDKKVILLEENISQINKEISTLKETIKEITKVQNQNFIYLKRSIDMILNTLKNRNLTPKEAMAKAKKLFFAGKLDEAREYFLYTLSKRYLPATSAYYLGEIAFKKGNYKEALAYYKKSIEFYPKRTSFTPRLLYHSAISFEKLGDRKKAILTLKKIIKDYSDSKYSKLAKKELEKLQ